MKKSKDRVFAYTLATAIDKSDLAEIAGGAAQGFCTRPTMHVSGNEHSWDTALDIVIDW
jgi:hypothetical protein